MNDPTTNPISQKERVEQTVGNYRLLEIIGEGAMGVVYLAEHTMLKRRVALKMLRPEHASNPTAVRRFFTEAQAVNTINHENIVEITDFIEHEGGDNCFIMELLRGQTLRQLEEQKDPVPLDRGLNIARQIAHALAAVHQAGIIHRDLKPDNVFLIEKNGNHDFVKLLDFGVAKLSADMSDKNALNKTNSGSLIGTPEYMSPEQVAGKSVDYRSDIYSFGSMMYQLFTTRLPFTAKDFGELVIKHLTQQAPRPSQLDKLPYPLPKTLEALILKCLQKKPDNRPQSVDDIARTLDQLYAAVTGGSKLAFAKRGLGRAAAIVALVSTLGLFGGLIAAAISSHSIDGSGKAVAASAEPAAIVEEPAAPITIQIVLESQPSGADVFLVGENQSLGHTPLTLTYPQSHDKKTFEIRLAGYGTTTKTVVLDQNMQLSTMLAPSPVDLPLPKPSEKRARATTRPTPKSTLKDDTGLLDPFAQ